MKKIIITGASSGLGRRIADYFLEKKYEVVNLSRTKAEGCTNIIVDLKNDSNIESACEIIKHSHNEFQYMFFNAGTMPQANLGKIAFNIDDVFKINVSSIIKILNYLNSEVLNNEADIIITGSTSAYKHFEGDIVYSATKFAVRGLIQSLQSEYKYSKTRIFGFHPGAFNSNLRGKGEYFENFMDPKDLATLLSSIINLPKNIEVSEIIVNRKKQK